MSERRNSLSPPSPTKPEKEDPGAHELAEASDSEDHFSDAQSGPAESHPTSPIPRTRVERVDDKPAYGEVPGTKAYSMREEDAAPDEIAFIPDPDSKPASGADQSPRSPTPGGHPIPKTVVEEAPDSEDSVTHPETEEQQRLHRADPPPDLVLKADGQKVDNGGEPDTPISATSLKTPISARSRRRSSAGQRRSPLSPSFPSNTSAADGDGDDVGGGDDDDFGDDFDDFEEGEEDAAGFGDFDDGFQQAEQISQPPAPTSAPAPAAPPPPQQPSLPFPIPSFDDLDASDIISLTAPYLSALFPQQDEQDSSSLLPLPAPSRDTNPIFLTPRSASLWSQLVAPPPLQPPDWIRSRIRRLFLVSLGVPVDLDEILPASKQKKLVLPSSLLHRVSSTGSLRRASTDTNNTPAGSRSLSRVRASGHNASSTSVDSQGNVAKQQQHKTAKRGASKSRNAAGGEGGGGGSSSRKRPPPEPDLDLTSAKQLCMTTDEALGGMTDGELRNHIAKLEAMQGTAHELLEYWQKRTDENIGDREAFEGVIENLVKHARKTRK